MLDVLRVRRAIAALPPELRDVVRLAYIEGYTRDEIRAELGLDWDTVVKRKRAGIQMLREALRS